MPRALLHPLRAQTAYRVQHGIYAFSFSLYATYASVRRVLDLGFDPLELVVVGTALEASVFLLEIPTGVVADLRGRRLSVAIGYAVIAAGFALEALSHGLLGIVVAQVIWGGGWTFVSGARSAWLVDEIGAEAAAPVMLSTAQLSRACALAGLAVSAALAVGGLTWPIAAAAAGFALLALAVPLFMEERGFEPHPGGEGRWREMGETLRQGLSVARGQRVVALLLLVSLSAGASSEAFDRLWVLHLTELSSGPLPRLGALPGVTWFALLQAAALVLGIASLAGVRRLTAGGRLGEGPVLAGLYGLTTVAMGAFALAGGFAAAVLAWLAVEALRSPMGALQAGWANRHIPSRSRATVLSILGQGDALGQVLGGPGLGGVGRAFGVRAALAASALLLAPGALLLGRDGLREADPPPKTAGEAGPEREGDLGPGGGG